MLVQCGLERSNAGSFAANAGLRGQSVAVIPGRKRPLTAGRAIFDCRSVQLANRPTSFGSHGCYLLGHIRLCPAPVIVSSPLVDAARPGKRDGTSYADLGVVPEASGDPWKPCQETRQGRETPKNQVIGRQGKWLQARSRRPP